MNKASHHIEDLARLAREGCVYSDYLQQTDTPLPPLAVTEQDYSNRPLQKLVALLKPTARQHSVNR